MYLLSGLTNLLNLKRRNHHCHLIYIPTLVLRGLVNRQIFKFLQIQIQAPKKVNLKIIPFGMTTYFLYQHIYEIQQLYLGSPASKLISDSSRKGSHLPSYISRIQHSIIRPPKMLSFLSLGTNNTITKNILKG